MHIAMNPKLDHPAYHASVSIPKYNGQVTVFRATSTYDAAKVLKKANPDWSADDHLKLASLHVTEAGRQQVAYNTLLDEAAQETFGRPFQVTDYRISAIASDAFSAEKKSALRKAAHARTYHEVVGMAHAKAARLKR